jgi:hypothetical protein
MIITDRAVGIVLEGYNGTWFVVDSVEALLNCGEETHLLFLLSSETDILKKEQMIVNSSGKVIKADILNDFDSLYELD